MTRRTNFSSRASGDAPAPERRYSADELKRFHADTRALSLVAAHALIAQTAERLSTRAEDTGTTAEDLRESLMEAAATLTQDESAMQRATCDALHLFRVCPRQRCRKAQRCRGDAAACETRAQVPEAVLDEVATRMLAAHVPWVKGRAGGRIAFECWIAGIEVGARG